jgi:hypothetical protein
LAATDGVIEKTTKSKAARSNVALRIPVSLKAEAERVATAEGTTLNTLISIALAEKLSVLRTADYFAEWAGRANAARALEILERAGTDGPVQEGDEVG